MTLQRFASLGRALTVIGLSVVAYAAQFHLWHGDFLQTGLGDWVDPYFINYLLEHWRHALLTLSNPASPPMFYPATGTLGYSCGLILFAPFYIVARLFFGPLPAYTVALFLVVETGTLALYVILRAFLRLNFVESIVLTTFVVRSPNLFSGYSGTWSQALSSLLIPPILLIGLTSGRLTRPRARRLMAAACGLLATLLFVQDFYTGWLALLIAALLMVGLVLVDPVGVCRYLAAIWRSDRPRILGFTAGATAGTLLFFAVYLGAYRQHSAFPGEMLMNALNYVNPDSWSNPAAFLSDLMAYESEAPFLLVAAIVGLAWLPWSRLDRRSQWLALWFGIVALIVLTSAVKFERYSVWKRLFQHLPGAAAIRDPKRLIYSYELAVVLGTGLFLARLPRRSAIRIAAVLIVSILVARERPSEYKFARPVATFDYWVNRPVAIDPGCRSFVIRDASWDYMARSGHIWTLYGVDSMFIALKHHLPTLNGYSGWEPAGWGLANPPASMYPKYVKDWITLHQLAGVCEFDVEKRTMVPYPERPLHP